MLNAFFIIDEKGNVMLTHFFLKDIDIDSEKIALFITALLNFSKDAFEEEMQVVTYSTKRLIITAEKNYTLDRMVIGVGVFDIIDHKEKAISVLKIILKEYIKQVLQKGINEKKYKDYITRYVLENTETRRNILFLLSLIVIIISNYLGTVLFLMLKSPITSVMILPSFLVLSGYFIGRKMTAATVAIMISVIYALLSYHLIEWISALVYLEDYFMVITSIDIFFTTLGAHISEKNKLNPQFESLLPIYKIEKILK
ncbi:MAG: hypothetical protein ACTSSP_05300 [Candidatus Asgardarchaeia archaeon]